MHPLSDQWVSSISTTMPIHPGFGQVYLGKPNGIPYQVVNGSQLEVSQLQLGYYGSNDASPPPGAVPVPVNFSDWSESDAGPYPLRADTPIEGCFPNETLTCSAGGDRHAIVLDASTCTLYELFGARAQQEETKKLVTPSSTAAAARWRGVSGAIFPMSWSGARRADGRQQCWTSADAAGLPILPGLVTYDEVQEAIAENRGIQHAVRFTAAVSQAAFVPPASHYASPHTNSTLAPMGARFRLRQDYDCGSMPP